MKSLLLLAFASVLTGAGVVPPESHAVRASMFAFAAVIPTMTIVAMMDDPTDAISREVAVGILMPDPAPDEATSREIAVAPTAAVVSLDSATSREIAVAPSAATVEFINAASREIAVEWNPDKPFFAESREIAVGGNRALTVRVEFQAIEISVAPTTTDVVVSNPDGVVIFSNSQTLVGSECSLANMPRMTLGVSAKTSHWLRKKVFINHGSIDLASLSLINGDVDEDNEITLVDVGELAAAFGSVDGDANWNPNADLDADEEVNLVDYGIVASNFGVSGDDE